MKKLVLMILLMVPLVAGAAVEPNTHGLTDAQKAELVLQIEKMKQAKKKAETLSDIQPEDVERWGGTIEKFSKELGKGIVSLAKELGMAVNDFTKTGVGKLTVGILVWKLMGNEFASVSNAIFHVTAGVIWFTVMLLLWFYMVRRALIIDSVTTYEKDKGPDGKRKVIVYKDRSAWRDGSGDLTWQTWLSIWGMFFIVVLGLFITFSF